VLYTNPSTGEGITQSNDIPPFARDINRFRNVVFYANTKTRYRLSLNIIGVEDLIAEAGNSPTLTIVDENGAQDYLFVLGTPEIWDLTCIADTADSINGDYFDVYSAKDRRKYRFYYKTSGGADTPPAVTTEVLVRIDVITNDTANTIATKTRDTLNLYASDFNVTDNTLPTIRITNVEEGLSSDLDVGTSGFTKLSIQQGIGEDSNNKTVLLSNVVSPAQAVDLTARSLVRIINSNTSDSVYAYYVSGVGQIPGQILIESRTLNNDPFYAVLSSAAISGSFSPDFGPQYEITDADITVGGNITIPSHTFNDGDTVVITLTDTVPSINKTFVVQRIDNNTIKIPITLTTINTSVGTVSASTYAQVAENEDKSNRVYYSKYQQPEAVPTVNYFDVGARDKAILRIMPLRDSLFIFKVDGVYRVSGEVSPFNVQLFDSSTKLIAADTVQIVDNNIYGWTEQGIAMISESNVSVVSRVIDEDLLKIGSNNSTNFASATWGIGYESDNAYIVFTTKNITDTHATIGYRYSTLTNTWTNIDKSPVCGTINDIDDVIYLGASDTNYIEQERKSFDRTDYSDRELIDLIGNGKYINGIITLTDITGYSAGDVIVQDQTLTIYQYNNLLAQLDTDVNLSGGYETALTAVSGNNLRTKIEDLATMLDSDVLTDSDYASTIATQTFINITGTSVNNPTVITTDIPHNMFTGRLVTISGSYDSNPSIDGTHAITVIGPSSFSIDVEVIGAGTTGSVTSADQEFDDIKACYNAMVDKVNSDTVPFLSNYQTIDNNTLQETPILSINSVTKGVTTREALQYVSGKITIYKSIPTSFTYSPNTMGDPLGLKHLREAQILFENRALTSATMEFATDLLPQFEIVPFDLDGTGIFGSGSFGSGFFGGGSNSAPFRTYVPRNKQYCTFMRIRYTHNTAREHYTIFATTLTGEVGISSRTYR